MVTVSSYGCVIESHLQFIHGFQQQTLSFIVQVFKGSFLLNKQGKSVRFYILYIYVKIKLDKPNMEGKKKKEVLSPL